MDVNRCRDIDLLVNPATLHCLISQRCLEMMISELRVDICCIGQTVLNSEVPELPERIATHIPLPLQYACVHWVYHVCAGGIDTYGRTAQDEARR